MGNLLNYQIFSPFVRDPQDISGKHRSLRVRGRQVSGPVDLLAIGQAQLRIKRLPACAVLLADGHVEAHRWVVPQTIVPVKGARITKFPAQPHTDFDWLKVRTSAKKL